MKRIRASQSIAICHSKACSEGSAAPPHPKARDSIRQYLKAGATTAPASAAKRDHYRAVLVSNRIPPRRVHPLAAALALGACGSGATPDAAGQEVVASKESNGSPYQGTTLTRPFSKPDLVLTDTGGKPYSLREETAGKPLLLFFGYTSCPDVCPTTMGDIAVAMHRLPAAERAKVQVVFVSTDPKRDTPKKLRSWLDAFDKHFTGLTGDLEKVKKAARPLGILVEDPIVDKDGSVTSTHGAQVLAFLPSDDKAHILYLSQSSVDVFAHDLPLLAKGVQP